jgi:hypothetical protein
LCQNEREAKRLDPSGKLRCVAWWAWTMKVGKCLLATAASLVTATVHW